MFINWVNINTNNLCEMIVRHERLPYTGDVNDDSDLNEEMENGGGNKLFATDSSN